MKFIFVFMIRVWVFSCFFFAGFHVSAADIGENESALREIKTINMQIKTLEANQKKIDERHRRESLDFMPLDEIFINAEARALASAAGKGNVAEIDDLIARGVDANARGFHNATPLYWALRQENKEGFVRLLDRGADSTFFFEDGSGFLEDIVFKRDVFYLEECLKHGTNPNAITSQKFQNPMIFTAVIKPGAPGDNRAMDILLDGGSDVNVRGYAGSTPLLSAATAARYDRVFILLQHGADPALKSDRGEDLRTKMAEDKNRLNRKSELYSWFIKVQDYLDNHPTTK